mmetsp:Transcript_62189/g.185247  ORF Transcript_62189/g.185247 Transcript_62189/m.185247 type:complete len:345 (+) Transcript_62189:430-1464(+)
MQPALRRARAALSSCATSLAIWLVPAFDEPLFARLSSLRTSPELGSTAATSQCSTRSLPRPVERSQTTATGRPAAAAAISCSSSPLSRSTCRSPVLKSARRTPSQPSSSRGRAQQVGTGGWSPRPICSCSASLSPSTPPPSSPPTSRPWEPPSSTARAPSTMARRRPSLCISSGALGAVPPRRWREAIRSKRCLSRIARKLLWASWVLDSVAKSSVRARTPSSCSRLRCLRSDCAEAMSLGMDPCSSISLLRRRWKNDCRMSLQEPSSRRGSSKISDAFGNTSRACSLRSPVLSTRCSERSEILCRGRGGALVCACAARAATRPARGWYLAALLRSSPFVGLAG